MAQQLSPLRLLQLLPLSLWFAACCYTESQAVALEGAALVEIYAKMGGGGGIENNGYVVGGDNGGDVAGIRAVVNDCFEIFLQGSRNASNTYASAYRECLNLGKEWRTQFTVQQQSQREVMTAEMAQMCKEFHECSQSESDLAFFQCNKKNSYKNVNTLIFVYSNSSAAIVELEEKYHEADKEVMLCIIAAEEQYLTSTTNAYLQLLQCLRA
ncbi:uncharacterized protein LOC129246180 isoform X1 [Anastrepha obliqua]|uniref:uncharacterized protein LOC129246180 isoform X1 n=1 Tax=Anastrepha obliqua TaxID=95512 RepID=UPI00240A0775|nr:uncharacterized protein LOC129246180 isoform X1 [Anastrepha obliqua]